MKNIYCNECGKFLFATSESNMGSIGCEAQKHGFVYKNAVFFSEKYTSLYFCDHTCAKAFYDKNIPKNEEISNAIKKMKTEIPEMAKDVCGKMGNLIDNLKKKGLIK